MNYGDKPAGRIVFLSASDGVWGAEESLITLAKALKLKGRQVTLVCFGGPLAERWATDLALSPEIAGYSKHPDSTKLSSAFNLWRTYLGSAKRGDVVVLFTYYLVSLAPLTRIWLLGRNARVVLDMHDNLPGRKGRLLLQLFSIFIDGVISVSNYTASQFGLCARRVTVLTRPVDRPEPNVIANKNKSSDKGVRIGIVGRITRGKGHHLLLRAASLICDDFTLVVRGSGDGSAEDVEADVVFEGERLLGERFRFDGAVPRSSVMNDLDLLVVANAKEPLGRTVIEAQLNGVVAVVPDAGGSSELVEDGVTGRKYGAGDAASLAETLASLIKDGELRKELAAAGRAEALVTSSPSNYASSYEKALEPHKG